jgi:hypothetical protein
MQVSRLLRRATARLREMLDPPYAATSLRPMSR